MALIAKFGVIAFTLAAGAVGALGFALVGVPAAFLTGSAVTITAVVALGLPTSLPIWLRDPSFAVLGLMIGSAVTPETLTALIDLPLAAIGLVIAVVGALMASFSVLHFVGKWDPLTAYCGSIPGALQTTLAVAVEAGARMERVMVAQVIRLFILVSLVPLLFGTGDAPDLNLNKDAGGGIFDDGAALLVALVAMAVGKRLRVPSAAMMTPLIVAAVLSASGIYTFSVPTWLAAAAFILLGAAIATRFSTMRPNEVLPILGLSLMAFAAAASVAMAVAAAVGALIGEPLGAVFLAYAPGGIEGMIALAFLLNFDVAFVAVLQVSRLVALSVLGPIVAIRLFSAKPVDRSDGKQ